MSETSLLKGARERVDFYMRSILQGPFPPHLSQQLDLSEADLIDDKITEDRIVNYLKLGTFHVRLGGGAPVEAFVSGGAGDGDEPMDRYGVGVLWPAQNAFKPWGDEAEALQEPTITQLNLSPFELGIARDNDDENDGTENEATNRGGIVPSSIGISFSIPESAATVTIAVDFSSFRRIKIVKEDKEQNQERKERLAQHTDLPRYLWLNQEHSCSFDFSIVPAHRIDSQTIEKGNLSLELGVVQRHLRQGHKALTAYVTNRSDQQQYSDLSTKIAFRPKIIISCKNTAGAQVAFSAIEPTYGLGPRSEIDGHDLLFANERQYAIGHGVAASWTQGDELIRQVWTETMPTVSVPSISSEFSMTRMATLKEHELEMRAFVGTSPETSSIWLDSLSRLGDAYAGWITSQESVVSSLPIDHQPAARQNLTQCARALSDYRTGIEVLRSDKTAREAFTLTNEAMLGAVAEKSRGSGSRRAWRPFQIFFLVMNIRGIVSEDSEDRDLVEVVWLPTGGGKTEAYLALASFAIWHRRLRGIQNGTAVLMRYTLRLLTAQQLERASRLIIAMDEIRRRIEPNQRPISIGLWIGGDQTPNSRKEATAALELMSQGKKSLGFGLAACPMCKTPIGPDPMNRPESSRRAVKFRKVFPVPGIRKAQNSPSSVEIYCPIACTPATGEAIPVLVVDDDIYANPPDFLLGTVDKLAVLAWNPRARSIFGIDSNGARGNQGISLVIQDELHMISGSIGTSVSMYEPLIDLLSVHGDSNARPPKIVCSSATIRDYSQQVRQLYGRESSRVFPPPALRHGESFFASDTDEKGVRYPGTTFSAIYAPALRSNQAASVRIYSAALVSIALASKENYDVDNYGTLVAFYNALRELGYARTLINSDIPRYLQVLKRNGWIQKEPLIREPLELTSRIEGAAIPNTIKRLEARWSSEYGVDICLASTMIEVGLDIDRLSMMVVMGQPKSRSTYIQVTGRVGRNWRNSPGQVYTQVFLGKTRDISMYEHFHTVHRSLYSEVTPTLLAPFIQPARDRYLRATCAAFIRQTARLDSVRYDSTVASSEYDVGPWAEVYVSRADDAGYGPEMRAEVNQVLEELRSRAGRPWMLNAEMRLNPAEGLPMILDPGVAEASRFRRSMWLTPRSLRSVETPTRLGPRDHY